MSGHGGAGRTRTLAQVYRRFGEVDAADTSPLYERVAVALSESDEALRAIGKAPARKRHPTVILAALHDLVLAGRAPALAAAYATADVDAAADAAIDTVTHLTDAVVAIAVRRRPRTNETGHCAVLYPAIAEVARRAGATALGLIDVTDADDARWLRACVWPDQPERAATLDAELALAATGPPLQLRGDAIETMPAAFTHVPADALPVVTTTWALSHLPLEGRLRFLHGLDEAADGGPVAWVSAEGVGVAPAIPTLGDRRASGHSIIGLALFDRSAVHAEAIGRCWSRGRMMAWLGEHDGAPPPT